MGLFVCECSKHSEMTSVAGKAETQALEMECLVFSKKLFFFFFFNSEEEYCSHAMYG